MILILVYFILGIVFAIFSSVIDGLASIVLTAFEVLKGKMNVKIAKYNSQIQNLEIPSSKSHAIGFVVEEEYDDEEDNDDDEEIG